MYLCLEWNKLTSPDLKQVARSFQFSPVPSIDYYENLSLLPDLIDAISHSLQRELSRSVHCLAVISGSPAGTVDVDNLRHVADGWCLDDISHKGLVQHPDTWKSNVSTWIWSIRPSLLVYKQRIWHWKWHQLFSDKQSKQSILNTLHAYISYFYLDLSMNFKKRNLPELFGLMMLFLLCVFSLTSEGKHIVHHTLTLSQLPSV